MVAFWRMRWFDGIHKKACSTKHSSCHYLHRIILVCASIPRKNPHMFMDYVSLDFHDKL